MQLKDYIPHVNKKYSNIFFSGISFDSSKVKKNSKVLNHQPDFVCVSGNMLPKRRKETALFATEFAATATKPPKSGKDVQVCR